MKNTFTLCLLCAVFLNGRAQGYGAQWIIGPNTSALDFRVDTVGLDTISGYMNTWEANADICDINGNLLYYTNGDYIAGSDGNILINGDTISPCLFTDENYSQGIPLPQAVIFLPKPSNPRYYYLFHFSLDTLNRPNTIYYSLIDKEGNSGLGTVIQKNVPILKLHGDTILRGGGMTACKHANGRDYWIVIGGSNNNEFYKFLLTPDTIIGPFIQYIGAVLPTPQDVTYSKFSQDGSKYVTSCFVGSVLVMDFDRCSGEFSNPITLFNNDATDSNNSISGCVAEEFSPNGRFVYVSGVVNLNQYDLWADTIQDSTRIWTDSDTDFHQMDMLQVAPNGKIYGSTWNGGLYALHVINSPDSLGANCSFVYGGQPTLSSNSTTLPNMINYNLGPLVGSACDTLMSISGGRMTTQNPLRVMPNPADKYVYVEMGMQGNYEFDLLNTVGQVIDRKETRQVDIFDTEALANGVYIIKVTDKGHANAAITQKLVVQH